MNGCRSIWLTAGRGEPASSSSWICFVPQFDTWTPDQSPVHVPCQKSRWDTHADGLDQSFLLCVHTCPPALPPDFGPADGRVEEVKVKVVHSSAFQRSAEVFKGPIVAPERLQLGSEEDRIARGSSGFWRLSSAGGLSHHEARLELTQVLVDCLPARGLVLVPTPCQPSSMTAFTMLRKLTTRQCRCACIPLGVPI